MIGREGGRETKRKKKRKSERQTETVDGQKMSKMMKITIFGITKMILFKKIFKTSLKKISLASFLWNNNISKDDLDPETKLVEVEE